MTVGAAARTMIDVDVGDGVISTLVAGTGPEVVMLHGWTLDHRNWLPQLPLADRARLVMPDRRGFGRSSAPPHLADEWRDIDHVAGNGRFILVGLSQGASVALDYARRRPDRVAALVLAGAPLHGVVPQGDAEHDIPRLRYADMIRSGQLAQMKAEWAGHPLVQSTNAARPLLDSMLEDYDGRDLLVAPSPIAIGREDISALPMPVLAIAGTGDTVWRRSVAAFIGAAAPNGHMISVDDAGHLCNLDNPPRFNAILADLLTSTFN